MNTDTDIITETKALSMKFTIDKPLSADLALSGTQSSENCDLVVVVVLLVVLVPKQRQETTDRHSLEMQTDPI